MQAFSKILGIVLRAWESQAQGEGLWAISTLKRQREENIRISTKHGHWIDRDSVFIVAESRTGVSQPASPH